MTERNDGLRTFDFKANGHGFQMRAVSLDAAVETLHRTLPKTHWHSLRESVPPIVAGSWDGNG